MSAKKLTSLATATALTLSCSFAFAGGPDQMSCQPTALNTGFYIGAGPNYGFGTSVSNWGTSQRFRQGMRGWGGQLLGGYDYRLPNRRFYLGANMFFQFNDINSRGTTVANTYGHIDLDYLWGVVAEPGYVPADNVHLYARIGAAYGWFELENSVPTTNDYSKFGFLLGVGSEVALSQNFALRGDYTFYNFGKEQSGNPSAIVRPFYGIFGLTLTYHF